MSSKEKKSVLWWGRSDPQYSRNRIIRQIFIELNWTIIDFVPKISAIADIELYFCKLPPVDLVWVPCFRQKDLTAASRWSHKKKITLIFDPLISAYDKQVWERQKFSSQSKQARKLLHWEKSLFQSADIIIADTEQHAKFYADTFFINAEQIIVLPVSAEESLFLPQKNRSLSKPLHVLFYGSYIDLQGPNVIAQAILLYQGPPVNWYFIGDGPLRQKTQERLRGLTNVHFSNWIPYEELPKQIAQADLCLGIFGSTQKTQRVIANKVYQALACARHVITCESGAYPESLKGNVDTGLFFVPANNPKALALKLTQLANQPNLVKQARQHALLTYQQNFSNSALKEKVSSLLQRISYSKPE